MCNTHIKMFPKKHVAPLTFWKHQTQASLEANTRVLIDLQGFIIKCTVCAYAHARLGVLFLELCKFPNESPKPF